MGWPVARRRKWANPLRTGPDPLYDEKLRDIVALYLTPPPGATILSIDEKPSIQALSRKYPDLPMRPGEPVAREFEYVRHGVMHLFAGFNVRSGHVLGRVYQHKTRAEFIAFLERCAWRYRQGPVHCVLDNASYHSTPEVKTWLAEHPRFTFHFTPTHASWLNQVECWFSILSRKVLRRAPIRLGLWRGAHPWFIHRCVITGSSLPTGGTSVRTFADWEPSSRSG